MELQRERLSTVHPPKRRYFASLAVVTRYRVNELLRYLVRRLTDAEWVFIG